MNERGVLHFVREGQRAQPGAVLVVEPLARPFRGGARPAVEPLEIEQPGHAVLVVTGDDGARTAVQQLDARHGVGAVADAVAEAEHAVGAGRGIGEHGAQRLQVAVDVRQDGVPHGRRVLRPDAAPGGCGRARR